ALRPALLVGRKALGAAGHRSLRGQPPAGAALGGQDRAQRPEDRTARRGARLRAADPERAHLRGGRVDGHAAARVHPARPHRHGDVGGAERGARLPHRPERRGHRQGDLPLRPLLHARPRGGGGGRAGAALDAVEPSTRSLVTDPPPARSAGVNATVADSPPRAMTFEELYRDTVDDLYAYVATLVRDRAAAEDVVAAAFERAYRRRSGYDARRGSQRQWLFGIA